MPRRCTICDSPARPAIEAALIGGQKQTAIAEAFNVSRSAVGRHHAAHMDHPTSIIEQDEMGLETGAPEPDDDIEAQLQALISKAYSILAKAERSASVDTQIRVLAELRKQLELWAKLADKIADQLIHVQLLNVIVTDNGDETGSPESRPVGLLAGPAQNQGSLWGAGLGQDNGRSA